VSLAAKTEERQESGLRPAVRALYLLVTVVVNFGVLAVWPKMVTRHNTELAKECLAFCVVPVCWGAYLPFACRKSFQAWFVSGLAILGGVFWLYVAACFAAMILKG
jgi:hypothetical protein